MYLYWTGQQLSFWFFYNILWKNTNFLASPNVREVYSWPLDNIDWMCQVHLYTWIFSINMYSSTRVSYCWLNHVCRTLDTDMLRNNSKVKWKLLNFPEGRSPNSHVFSGYHMKILLLILLAELSIQFVLKINFKLLFLRNKFHNVWT